MSTAKSAASIKHDRINKRHKPDIFFAEAARKTSLIDLERKSPSWLTEGGTSAGWCFLCIGSTMKGGARRPVSYLIGGRARSIKMDCLLVIYSGLQVIERKRPNTPALHLLVVLLFFLPRSKGCRSLSMR